MHLGHSNSQAGHPRVVQAGDRPKADCSCPPISKCCPPNSKVKRFDIFVMLWRRTGSAAPARKVLCLAVQRHPGVVTLKKAFQQQANLILIIGIKLKSNAVEITVKSKFQ